MLSAEVREALLARGKSEPAYITALHPHQRKFVEDPARKKAACCTRRAGKTEADAAFLLLGAEDSPGAMSVYITLTRNNARMIMWRTLEEIERRYALGLKFTTEDQQLIVVTKNGHKIWLVGCKDSTEIEKFRGMKYRNAVVDEAQAFGAYLHPLVSDVLEPALMDLRGTLALTGTPGPVPAGYFYQATTGDNQGATNHVALWPTHTWSILDNPYLPHAAEELARMMRENNWTEDHPTYQREWLGRWVRDESAIVYPYDGPRNACRDLPDFMGDEWFRVIGTDPGYVDDWAFSVLAYKRGLPDIYVLESWGRSEMIPSHAAVELEKLRAKYKPSLVVADVGGFGKGPIEEFIQRYGIAIEPAQKTDKLGHVAMLRGDILSGAIKVHPFECSQLLDEWMRIQYDETRTKILETPDHCADATLYAWRAIRNRYRPEEVPPAPGTPEAVNAEAASLKAQLADEMRRKAAERWRKEKKALERRMGRR